VSSIGAFPTSGVQLTRLGFLVRNCVGEPLRHNVSPLGFSMGLLMESYYIWIEAEQWSQGEWDPTDCNSDVMVSFEQGAKWVATFFSYQNILSLAKKNQKSGECLNGKYFWATDMIMVDELSRERVEEVVSHLIANGEFRSVFRIADV